MHNHLTNPQRVLVVGRSPDVLVDVVEILRDKGYVADASNQFDRVLDDYDVTELDILVFGGMVPPDTKEYLRQEIRTRNPGLTFVQGLAGIAGLIAAQVECVAGADAAGETAISYDAAGRTVEVGMTDSARVTVEAYWLTSWTPPQPKSTSMRVFDAELDGGVHTIPLPAEVPFEASFITVAVDAVVHAFTVGPIPQAVTRIVPAALPPVASVTTHGQD